eukprot:gnl/TRDRNA2_/TRDRNA2_172057_c0_seq1.p1 gnl/TRDRNA2_/TRDRNA2_172057_c0~~gnl/TRDRNA2_/TRDRNA2_172057_c0_seq1.p1  ORF type:complete len:526 (+),score=61.58 gnl/TRDRNA2_/TRDRNA2_172057_c0_seq1:57-1580(+)
MRQDATFARPEAKSQAPGFVSPEAFEPEVKKPEEKRNSGEWAFWNLAPRCNSLLALKEEIRRISSSDIRQQIARSMQSRISGGSVIRLTGKVSSIDGTMGSDCPKVSRLQRIQARFKSMNRLDTFRTLLTIVLVVTVLVIIVVVGVGNTVGDEFMLFDDLIQRGNPGYLVDFFGGHCRHHKDAFAALLFELESYNLRMRWLEVSFLSRLDSRRVDALYFPSAVLGAPRVVLAHGIRASNLDSTVQAAAYFLRHMNISVLVPNLRNHGGYGGFNSVMIWKHQSRDLLGAWDYAVADPDGLLGGPVERRSVGLYGFEFGGLAALTAFGAEPEVPALLLDGAVHDVQDMLRSRIETWVPAFLEWAFFGQAWSRCEALAEQELDEDTRRLDGRGAGVDGFVGIIHSLDDQFVPRRQRDLLLDSLRAHGGRLDFSMQWYPVSTETGSCVHKRAMHLDHPWEYWRFLCRFWATAFSSSVLSIDRCSDPGAPPGLGAWQRDVSAALDPQMAADR